MDRPGQQSHARQTAAVFLAALIVLAWGAGAPGLATAYVDPVARILAQDEALYASSSLEMARGGDWITPHFLGRYALYKPPLLYWLSAAAAKFLGPTALAVRLPSILAGAGTVALVFAALQTSVPLAAALAGALLLLSSHLFFVLSRTGLTDALLVFEITLALFALLRDPRLDSAKSRWIFGIATGAAMMTKAAAGLLPLLMLPLAGVSFVRCLQAGAIAAAIAAPWHLWQFYAHPRWFWAEYFVSEHFTWGLGAPRQTTTESQIGFYVKRLFWLDPVLLLGIFGARRRILIVWTGVVFASVLLWQYRNAAYLVPLYPALAISAALAIPKRYAKLALAGAAILFLAKIAMPAQPFGLSFAPESVNPAKKALDEYAKAHKNEELILIDPDDQFYSATLGLARVRYLWIVPATKRTQLPLDFERLGIAVRAADFDKLDRLRPVFAQRLREFNLDSTDPLATVILAENPAEVRSLIAQYQANFYFAGQIGRMAYLAK